MTSKYPAFIDAVMAIEPHKMLDGKKPSRLLHVYFTNADSLWKDRMIILDLIYDDLELFKKHANSPDDQYNTNVIVNRQLVHGAAILLWCTIQGTPFVIKCNLAEPADMYESLYADHRMVTVIEREAESYERILDSPALREICLRMHAHGNMTSIDGKVMYEVMLIQQGGVDILTGTSGDPSRKIQGLRLIDMQTAQGTIIPKSQTDVKYCRDLTVQSFKLLKTLYQNGISHGDAKADQFVWATLDGHERRSLRLLWLDMGRGYLKDENLMSTWNLRMLIDISEMLMVNPWSYGNRMIDGHFSQVNIKEIKRNFGTSVLIDGRPLQEYLIPDMGLTGEGAYLVDKFSTEAVCNHYYPGKNLDYLERINPMAFLDYLLEGENLLNVINKIFALSRKCGQGTPSSVPESERTPNKYKLTRDPRAPPAGALPTQPPPIQPSTFQSLPAQVQPGGGLIPPQAQSLPNKTYPLIDSIGNHLLSRSGSPLFYTKRPFALHVDGTTYSNQSQIGPIEAWIFSGGVPTRANTGPYGCSFIITVAGNEAQMHMFEETSTGLRPLWTFTMA